MDNALTRRALHLGLRITQSNRCGGLVATGDCGFHLLDEGAHTRFPRVVSRGAGDSLTDALARRCGIGHAFFDQEVKGDLASGPRTGAESLEDAVSTHRPLGSQGHWPYAQ